MLHENVQYPFLPQAVDADLQVLGPLSPERIDAYLVSDMMTFQPEDGLRADFASAPRKEVMLVTKAGCLYMN